MPSRLSIGRRSVSIHAPTRRVTDGKNHQTRGIPSFDPRPRVAGDEPASSSPRAKSLFRFTPSHGGRPLSHWGAHSPAKFRSTPSHGGRRYHARQPRRPPEGFDPRPRMEGDTSAPEVCELMSMFRSTPSHGGRPRRRCHGTGRLDVSIHALAWRATVVVTRCVIGMASFDPRPRMEGDSPICCWHRSTLRFRSTPSHGGRPYRSSAGERP